MGFCEKVEQNCEKGEQIGRFDLIRFQYPASTQLKQHGRALHTYSFSLEKPQLYLQNLVWCWGLFSGLLKKSPNLLCIHLALNHIPDYNQLL